MSIVCMLQANTESTVSGANPAMSSDIPTPAFGRHVIMQVSPAVGFGVGPFSHLAVIPAQLRLALQRASNPRSPSNTSSSSSSSSSASASASASASSSQLNQSNPQSNAENSQE